MDGLAERWMIEWFLDYLTRIQLQRFYNTELETVIRKESAIVSFDPGMY